MTQRVVRRRETAAGEFVTAEIESAGGGVDEFYELIIRGITNPIVVCITREAVGWIGEKLVDDDVPQRAAADGYCR